MCLVVFKLFGLIVHLLVKVRNLAISYCGVIFFNILDCSVYLNKFVHSLIAPLLQRVDLRRIC